MQFKSTALPLGIVLFSSFMSGCATITGTTSESITVQTLGQEGKEVRGAACELANKKGKWFVTSPGSATVTRSNDDMQVVCSKQGTDPGRASVVSATKAAMFGNVILGGGVGAIVDYNSGAAYEYPRFIQVMMGTFTKIDAPKLPEEQLANRNPNAQPPKAPPATTQPATTSLEMVPAPVLTSQAPQEDEFKDLKKLYDDGLISQDVYVALQRKSLEDASRAAAESPARRLYVIPDPR